jgi:hypothetical protein
MTVTTPTAELPGGVHMPVVGLGTGEAEVLDASLRASRLDHIDLWLGAPAARGQCRRAHLGEVPCRP